MHKKKEIGDIVKYTEDRIFVVLSRVLDYDKKHRYKRIHGKQFLHTHAIGKGIVLNEINPDITYE